MKNLICPNCGKPFSIDDADYAQLLSQVKNDEFKAEVDSRVSELRSLWLQEQEAASLKAENAHQQALNVQQKKLQEREAEIQTLKERLSSVEQIKAAGIPCVGKELFSNIGSTAGNGFTAIEPERPSPTQKWDISTLLTDGKLRVVKDETVDAINTITEEDDDNAPIYDLQGRRVHQPTKGIFIRNGKKIIK